MLTIRYLRSGRANNASFRIVLTEKSKPCDSGFIKVLGWYNPHTKKVSLDNEAVLSWIDKGASVSNSVAKLLTKNGIKHKNIKFIPDAPKAKKGKKDESEKPKAQPQIETSAEKDDSAMTKATDEKLDQKIPEKEPEKTEEKLSTVKEKNTGEDNQADQKQEPAPKAPAESSENK
jgi:small subunit ribosomal protein S16